MTGAAAAGRELSSAKPGRGDKAAVGGIVAVVGAAAVYLALGGIGSLVTKTDVTFPRMAIGEQNVAYVERLPANAFWRKFPVVDKEGYAVWTVTAPDGGLVARLTDNDNNGLIGKGDIVNAVEEFYGIKGLVEYPGGIEAVDSDGTRFTEPKGALQGMIAEHAMNQRTKWNIWMQQHYPEIKAKLQEQQKQYQQQRR
ncbi:hypothetical protein HYU17_04220 [Candidatus Woesearchaeota archaeon]|nr:hypothetical protein [Candidatus Woesearchaeota archaeon]